MKKGIHVLAISLLIVLLACSTSEAKSQSEVKGTSSGSMEFEGLKRTYVTHVPPGYDDAKQVPLVIALHGGGGTGVGMEKLTGFSILSDDEDFLVVYPDGVDKHWNDGRYVSDSRASKENINDVGFILALIDELASKYKINPKKVYVTGISNGAMMSFRLACDAADRFAAIAVVAGNISVDLAPKCSPVHPISVLIINGTQDPMMPWGGGEVGKGWKDRGKVFATLDTFGLWQEKAGIVPGSEQVTILPDLDPKDGTKVRVKESHNPSNGCEVALYAIECGGHTWPDGWQYLPQWMIGKNCRDINATRVIWEFFKRH